MVIVVHTMKRSGAVYTTGVKRLTSEEGPSTNVRVVVVNMDIIRYQREGVNVILGTIAELEVILLSF